MQKKLLKTAVEKLRHFTFLGLLKFLIISIDQWLLSTTIVFVFTLCQCHSANAQITKGNWLMGGKGSFNATKSEIASATGSKLIYVRLTPAVGYFIKEKFAVGLQGLVDHQKTSFGSSDAIKQTTFYAGPFARYYLLSTDNKANVFAEAAYSRQVNKPGKSGANSYAFTSGAVLFLNVSVGIELVAGYDVTDFVRQDLTYKSFRVGIGFQIHLERE